MTRIVFGRDVGAVGGGKNGGYIVIFAYKFDHFGGHCGGNFRNQFILLLRLEIRNDVKVI